MHIHVIFLIGANMTKRVFPEKEKFASCPYDERILEYYEGVFDSVYIMLHPFICPINIDRFCAERWPSKHEMIKNCKAVSWHAVLEMSGLKTISEIDIGLRSYIGRINKKLSNADYVERLVSTVKRNQLIFPLEGDLSPLIENRIFNALRKTGYDWAWVGNEHGTERKLWWLEDLMEGDEVPSHGCIFTHDHSILITTHWDSHCSFLCSSKKIIERILKIESFEGFYCTPNTEVYWGAYEI